MVISNNYKKKTYDKAEDKAGDGTDNNDIRKKKFQVIGRHFLLSSTL